MKIHARRYGTRWWFYRGRPITDKGDLTFGEDGDLSHMSLAACDAEFLLGLPLDAPDEAIVPIDWRAP